MKISKNNLRILLLVSFIILGILMLGSINSANAWTNGVDQVCGKTYGEWSASWWQWVQSIPAGTNPLVSGPCHQNQRGPVWFLAGNQGGTEDRDCTVPRGKFIFFPIVNIMFFNDPETYTPVEDKRFVVDAVFSENEPDGVFNSRACELSCTLDGEPTVYKFPIVRTQSPPFRIKFIADSIFDYGYENPPLAGWVDEEIVSDGFWVMLPPLSRGVHELHFTGSICGEDGGTVLLTEPVDITYTLTIQ
jgi:hypothetical protein